MAMSERVRSQLDRQCVRSGLTLNPLIFFCDYRRAVKYGPLPHNAYFNCKHPCVIDGSQTAEESCRFSKPSPEPQTS